MRHATRACTYASLAHLCARWRRCGRGAVHAFAHARACTASFIVSLVSWTVRMAAVASRFLVCIPWAPATRRSDGGGADRASLPEGSGPTSRRAVCVPCTRDTSLLALPMRSGTAHGASLPWALSLFSIGGRLFDVYCRNAHEQPHYPRRRGARFRRIVNGLGMCRARRKS